MKNQIITALMSGFCFCSMAQNYCAPPPFTSGPFTGIVEVSLGDWIHESEYDDGVMFFEEETLPELTPEEAYDLTVKCEHTIPGGGFSGNLNYRVWIDWNQDMDFDDEDELVLEVDGLFYTETAMMSFEVPEDALSGETRMRVYNDMPVNEGHDNPNPCGYASSANPVGHHGEVEDYIVTVAAQDTVDTTGNENPNGIRPNSVASSAVSAFYGNEKIQVNLEPTVQVQQVTLYDGNGRFVSTKALSQSQNHVDFDASGFVSGLYLLRAQGVNIQRGIKIIIP